jgi:protoporphyrin/coproporphyrin ferrochelatase
MAKTAVVLFNLGGPDKPESVRPFLFNLFNDPAIIGLPNPFRYLLAHFISARRAPLAREIYAHMGGGSPLLANTKAQGQALETALKRGGGGYRVFIAMRYWHPFADEAAAAVKDFAPDRIVLLPLYPQFSTTTTGSSLKDWERAAGKAGLLAPARAVCCYPTLPGFVDAVAGKVNTALRSIEPAEKPRVLFSAHGLPKKIVAAGDPYPWQVEKTVAAVAAEVKHPGFDWRTCYQSRVGPLEWIGPATDAEIERCGREGRACVVVPIAFVSEHSETLVELDIEYRELARRAGVRHYVRVGTVGSDTPFIESLAEVVREAEDWAVAVAPRAGESLCGGEHAGCPLRTAA